MAGDIAEDGRMRLHWSPFSPFVRKVLVVAHEHGIADRIRLVRTPASMSSANAAILPDNPLGRLPTLVLPDGTGIFDSRVIYRHLDSIGLGPRLMPPEGRPLLEAMRAEAMGHGLCELFVLWRNERGRAATLQSEPHLAAFAVKTATTLDRLEMEAEARAAEPFDFGHVSTGCGLAYCDFRFPDLEWRKGRPRLSAWHEAFAARPSALATAIPA
ncbi:glutathione S-transferase family protein [Sphingomonas sp.]|uniref:glutathione S-transferase family protein n=1 Tax=Sphingomonas sp. TaxID=28214 RepID=UPI002ED9B73C